MRPSLARIDRELAELPTVTFGSRSLMWWGTMGFIVIEGWTIAILIVAYLYLRQNYPAWPPPHTPMPSLLIPTINLGVLVASVGPGIALDRAAKRFDRFGVKRWLIVGCVFEIAALVLRWKELWALNTRWDTTAYASAAWTVVGFHTSLLVLDFIETAGLTLFFLSRSMPVKAFSDASDSAFYWFFSVAIWIPIYVIVYVGPRFL